MSKRLSFSIAVNLLTENFKKGANTVKNSFKSMQMQILTFAAALGAGGLGIMGLITKMKDVARETSRAVTALKNVSGGTRQFGDNLKFINGLAKQYGIEVTGLTESFVRFTASATQAGMSMDNQRKIFESVSRSISAFNLSSDESKGVMLALSQMMGKGKISSEELRKQMGEKLPIAMQAMAKAAGTSMAGLEKLLQQGKLMTADILPKFAEALDEMIPEIDTDNLETSLNRLLNMFGNFVEGSGMQQKFKAIIDGITKLIEVASNNINNIIIGIVGAIVFVITNAANKVRVNLVSESNKIIAYNDTMQRKLIIAKQQTADAEVALEKAKAALVIASKNQELKAAQAVSKAEKVLQTRRLQEHKAQETAKAASTQASALTTSNAWQRATNVIRIASAKAMLSLKAMWASFAPAIIISALVTIGYKIYDLITSSDALKTSLEKYNKVKDETLQKEQEHKNKVEELITTATNQALADMERAGALEELKKKYPQIFKEYDIEKLKLADILKLKKAIAEMDNKQSVADRKTKYEDAKAKVQEAERNLENAKKSPTMRYERTRDAQRRLDRAKADLIPFEQDVVNDNINSFISNLGGMSKEQIESELKARQQLEHKLKQSGKTQGVVSGGELEGNFSKEQLSQQTEALKTELDKRNQARYDYVELEKKYNGELKSLQNRRKDIEKSSSKLTEQELTEQLKNIDGEIAAKQTQIKELTSKNPKSGSGDNKTLRAAEKRLEALRKLDEEDRKRQIEKQKFDLDLQQKAIDVLDDSFSKRTKQTLLNLQKEKLAIEEHQNELLKQQQEHLKTKYVSVKGDDKGFGDYFSNLKKNDFKDKDGNNILPEGLTPEDIKKQVDLLLDAAQKEQEKGLREINRDLTIMLKEQELMFTSDLDRKLADLDTYYNEQLIKAGDNAELIAQIESNRKRSKSEVKVEEQLNKLDFEEQLKQERIAGMESIGMTELVEEKKLEVTKQYIQLKMAALKELADAGDEDAKNQIKLYEASLKKLDTQKPAKSLKSLADKAIFDTIKKGFEKAGDSAEEAEEKTTSLLSSISHKAGIVANITSELQFMFGGMDEELDMAMETVGNIAQGFATGGIVGGAMAVIGEGMKLFSKASEAAARHQKALKEIEEDRLASQRAYNLLLLEQNLLLKEAVTIFGEKQITRAANAIANYRDSLKDLRDEMQGDFTPNAAYEQYLEKGVSSGGIMKAYFGNQLKDYRRQLDNYNKGVAALGDAQIVTGHKKTGLFGWGKGKDTYSSILEVYPDVIDKEGKLNKERLQTIIDTRKMSDETKKYLQNLIDLQDQAEAAQEELRNYLQSTFGSLGADIMTSLENAIKDKGVSAWEAFGEAGAKVIEELGKQIAYELFFADKFKKLQEQLEGVYGSGKDEDVIAREAMDIVGKFYQNIGSQMDLAQGFMENWQKEAEKYGLNLWKPDSSSTQDSSKGYSVSMDQDTGGAILGRVTGLHETGLRMEAFLKNISLDTSNYLSQSVSIANELKKQTEFLSEISQIQKKNFFKMDNLMEAVSPIGDMKDKLSQIEKNTKGLVTGK